MKIANTISIIILIIGLISMTNCNNERKMTEQDYFEKAKYMWQNFVPKSGQAETVQGELIRAIEKLRDEAQRNGNGNWDNGHVILVNYLRKVLISSDIFDDKENSQIKNDIERLLDYDNPYLDDDLYDRLMYRIVDWYMSNSEPIKHKYNPDLLR